MTNASESYDKLAHKTWVNCKICKICKILHRLNYSDFYFVQYQCNVIIVLEAHFNWLFLNKAYFTAYFEAYKIQLPFCFMLILIIIKY